MGTLQNLIPNTRKSRNFSGWGEGEEKKVANLETMIEPRGVVKMLREKRE